MLQKNGFGRIYGDPLWYPIAWPGICFRDYRVFRDNLNNLSETDADFTYYICQIYSVRMFSVLSEASLRSHGRDEHEDADELLSWGGVPLQRHHYAFQLCSEIAAEVIST